MLKIVEIISINNESEYFKFDFKKNMTEIKNELKENIGVNINEQLWFLNNIMIENNKINVKENDKIYVIIDNKWCNLYLNILNYRNIKLPTVMSNIEIKDLKYIISKKIKNINVEKFNLLFNGQILENNKKITDYNIVNNSRLTLTIKIKSGLI